MTRKIAVLFCAQLAAAAVALAERPVERPPAGMGKSKITTRDGQQKRIIYTPDDERIGVYLNQTLSRWTIRDFGGQVLREFEAHHQSAHPVDAIWLWVEDYIYAGGSA